MTDAWSTVWPTLVATLLGVIVGGLTTYFGTYALELRKWKQQKNDELRHDRRQALSSLMEWCRPIERAVTRANLLASPFRQQRQVEGPSRLVDDWPDLLGEIADLDLSPPLRVLAPSELYDSAHPIIGQLDRLRSLSLQAREERQMRGREPHQTEAALPANVATGDAHDLDTLHKEILETMTDLLERSARFRETTAAAYRDTYS